jgi:hypothetical protein
MVPRSVTVEPCDALFLAWHEYINSSQLFRERIRAEMAEYDISPRDLRVLIRHAKQQSYNLEELIAQTESIDELRRLVDRQPGDTN